jgi:hypothetical protein
MLILESNILAVKWELLEMVHDVDSIKVLKCLQIGVREGMRLRNGIKERFLYQGQDKSTCDLLAFGGSCLKSQIPRRQRSGGLWLEANQGKKLARPSSNQ